MAGAPELCRVGFELHRAIEMRADGAEGANLAVERSDDDAGLAAELEDRGGVRPECPGARGDDALDARFAARWRDEEPPYRIRDCRGRRHEANRQQRVEEPA